RREADSQRRNSTIKECRRHFAFKAGDKRSM
ncbi:uncharacterized protein METZ01_LOCUS504903, partial [marine metagenome]